MPPSALGSLFKSPATLRAHLIKLILAGLAPVLIFSAALIVLFARQEQATLTRGLLETTRALSAAVEKEFQSSIITLAALASAEALDTGEIGEFRRLAWRVLGGYDDWAGLTLLDPFGRPIFENAKPASVLAAIDRTSSNKIVREQQPVIGDFSAAAVDQVNIFVPVLREKKLIYVLRAAVERRAFAEILRRQQIPSEWIGTIFDRNRTIVARTVSPERFVGKPVGAVLQHGNSTSAEGIFRGTDLDDVASYAAVSTLPNSGWSVALSVPEARVNAPLWRSLSYVIGAGLISLLAGIWLASLFARRIAEPVWALSVSAKALGEGQADAALPALPIVELSAVAQDLQRTGGLLRERARERDRVEAELRERDEFLQEQTELLRQSEDKMRRQADELEQQLLASGRLVAVGELTASMAHEFNNPLGIILGFAQGMLAEMDPSHANYHPVQVIAEEAQRCARLVQELLEFGRPRSAEFAPVDLPPIVAKTLELVSNRAAKNNVQTIANAGADLPAIHADAQQLQQLLLNLSLNAVDAMTGGGTLTLSAARENSDRVILTIADTGSGIEANMLKRIFQPFVTTNKGRGLGLGLPICERIVKSHGGSIEVHSRVGAGTIFKVHLPIERKTPQRSGPGGD